MSYDNWVLRNLGEITNNYDKKRLPLSAMERVTRKGKYPYYGAQGIIDHIDDYIFEGRYLLIAEDGANLQTRNQDIALLTGVNEKFWVNNHAHIVDSNELSDIRYIKYYLNHYDISGYITGSAQPKLNQSNLHNIEINLPSVQEQRRIANILSSLDDKIELNNKINKNLEELAQTLYKRWFVDFEFPNEDGEPYKSSGGEMVESELGLLPKGWGFSKIDEITNLQIGRTPPRKEKEWFSYNPSDIKWYSIKDMGNSGIYIDSPSEFLTKEAISKFNIPIVDANIVLLSFKLTIGRLAITTSECTTNEAIAHMNILNDNISTNYLYLFLRNFNYESLGNTSSIATAVNSKTIKNIKVLIPDKNTLSKFTSLTDQIFNQIKNLQFQNQKLSITRDELLPKLMNGEIEVPFEE